LESIPGADPSSAEMGVQPVAARLAT
jgi:hypothetical protein